MFSLQITVPHSFYGKCEYFIAPKIAAWLKNLGLDYSLCGQNAWGNGYDKNGITNKETVYMVKDVQETDGIAFKIMFPKCGVFMSEQI